MKRRVFFVAFLLISAVVLYVVSSDRNRTAITSGKGYMSAGSKWGIQINNTEIQAHDVLVSNGFAYRYQEDDGRCGDQPQQGMRVKYYSDTGWRRGVLCLSIEEGVVRGIGWNYALGAP